MDKEVIETSHRKVFREEIRNAIREAIFSGELNPGDRIIETYWAKELGVSQMEALMRFYGTSFYRDLEDESTKLWHYSPEQLYALFSNVA